tara:strand:+ start:26056 stop:26532 length:477 start_codon:yes stop_codon:yes gene_type:complete
MSKKNVSNSEVIMHELVLPNETNAHGNIFGGKVMYYMDMCAAMSAYKHARKSVVTASVDRLNFLAPAKMGDILVLKSLVNYVSKTSMEVGVKIESENPITGKIKHTASAHLTFVALDRENKPTSVNPIIPESENEIRRYDRAKKRYMIRKQKLKEAAK